MKRRAVAWGIGILLAAATAARAAEPVPAETIRDAIRQGCERIMRTQRADGALVLDSQRFGGTEYFYPVGTVALGVLALQHAVPHLEGETAVRARESVRKALAWIEQRLPEQKTYSAGLALSILYRDDPRRHQRMIGEYASMLVLSQHRTGRDTGFWGYYLYPAPGRPPQPDLPKPGEALDRGDHSNTQFAVLGLIAADQSGFQIPARTWELLARHFVQFQNADGGWGYGPAGNLDASYANMTLVNTIGLKICEEMLFAGGHNVCKPLPENPVVDKGLDWITANVNYDNLETYGLYAVERLGILSGLSEIGGRPWFDEGARRLVADRAWRAHGAYQPDQQIGAAFAVLFLSRGLEPVIVNKLKRAGTDDWNNDAYDVKHLVEYVSTRFQLPKQWRIVTLQTDVDYLLRVPILYISGHEALKFTDQEKQKLKEYVERGGTILGMACCGRRMFDESFRALVGELWPGSELAPLPKTHAIYVHPRPLAQRPLLLGMALANGQGRLGVIYSPYDLCCRWHTGGTRAKPVFDVGANIYFYVDKTAPRLTGESAEEQAE